MTTHNPNNERIKRQYFAYLKEAKRHSEATVDAAAKALARFEATQVPRFPGLPFRAGDRVQESPGRPEQPGHGEKLSKATLHATLSHLKRFFQWLAGQPGTSPLRYCDADYFNLSEKDTRVATARRENPSDRGTSQARDRVGAGGVRDRPPQSRPRCLYASDGARDSAIASMKLKHIDLAAAASTRTPAR